MSFSNEKQYSKKLNVLNNTYLEKILKTEVSRNSYTEAYLSRKMGKEGVESFLAAMRKLFGLKEGISTVVTVLNIQKALGFPAKDISHGQDGKLGEYTFQEILKKYDRKQIQKSIVSTTKQSLKAFKKKENLGQQKVEGKEKPGPLSAHEVVMIGDSHSHMYAKYMKLNGAKNFKRIYKIGRSTRWMKKQLKRNIEAGKMKNIKTAIICGGANDMISSRAALYNDKPIEQDPIVKNLIAMQNMLREESIGTRFMTIPPMGRWIDKMKKKGKISSRTVKGSKERIQRINNWIKGQNRSIDLDPILIPNGGDSMDKQTSSDGLHFRLGRVAKEVAGKVINSIQA